MTTPAEARALVAEMNVAFERYYATDRAMMGTMITAALARVALSRGQMDDAATGARQALAELRNIPTGAHMFLPYDLDTINACVKTSAALTKEVLETMVADGADADVIAEHRAVLESLDRCADLLNRTTTLHAVLGEAVVKTNVGENANAN